MKHIKFTFAQLSMLKRISAFAFNPSNVGTTNSIPSLLVAFNLLNGKVATVDQYFVQYYSIITGYAAEKKKARLNLALSAFVIMKTAYAYACDNNDRILADKVATPLSKLQRMAYATLAAKIDGIITVLQPLSIPLSNYNPSIAAAITQCAADLAALNSTLTIPQSMLKARKLIGKNITAEMKEAIRITRQTIDSIVASMMITNPSYNSGYFVQRNIINPGYRHTTLEATLVNELGQPLGAGIKVTVNQYIKTDPSNNKTRTFPAKSAFTDINGLAVIKTFEPGPRTVTVSGNSIATQAFGPFEFNPGKTLAVPLTCQPQFSTLPASNSSEKVSK